MRKHTEKEILSFITDHPEVLQGCMTDGSIDMDGVEDAMKKHEKELAVAGYLHKMKRMNGKDTRWYIRVPDKNLKEGRKKIVAQTKEELIDKLYTWHCETRGINDVTIASLYKEYVSYKMSTTWDESSRKYYQSVWDNHISDCNLANMPIKAITLTDLELWAYDTIKKHKLTKKAWQNLSGLIGGIMRYATINKHVLDHNVYPDLVITNKAVFRQPVHRDPENLVLDPADELKLYVTCWNQYIERKYSANVLLPLGIICMFQIGCRPSELVCLKEDDVHEDKITISRYFSEKADKVLDQKTKSGHGPRDIVLTELAQGIIAEAIRYKDEHEIDTQYIFHVGSSMYSFYNRMRLTLPVLCKLSHVPRQTPYCGRRTFASSLIDSGVNLKTIQEQLGHLDGKTTINNYTYDRASKKEQARQIEKARSPEGVDFLIDLVSGKKM